MSHLMLARQLAEADRRQQRKAQSRETRDRSTPRGSAEDMLVEIVEPPTSTGSLVASAVLFGLAAATFAFLPLAVAAGVAASLSTAAGLALRHHVQARRWAD